LGKEQTGEKPGENEIGTTAIVPALFATGKVKGKKKRKKVGRHGGGNCKKEARKSPWLYQPKSFRYLKTNGEGGGERKNKKHIRDPLEGNGLIQRCEVWRSEKMAKRSTLNRRGECTGAKRCDAGKNYFGMTAKKQVVPKRRKKKKGAVPNSGSVERGALDQRATTSPFAPKQPRGDHQLKEKKETT